MASRFFAILFIFLALIGSGIWEQLYTNKTIDELVNKVIYCNQLASNSKENLTQNKELGTMLDDLLKHFENTEKSLCTLVNTNETEHLGEHIVALKTFYNLNDYQRLQEEFDMLLYHIKELNELLDVSFQSIF